MKSYTRVVVLAVLLWAAAAPAAAQGPGNRLRSETSAPGWVFIPMAAFAGTYDDNVSLFGRADAAELNNDFVSTLYPAADVQFTGKQTQFGAGYSGSLVNYRTFSELNRWNQSGRAELSRQESMRLSWNAGGSVISVPSTDLIDLGGIPFQHSAATSFNARGNVEYLVSRADTLGATLHYQRVEFEPTLQRPALPGGRVRDLSVAYRRRQSERFAFGANYSIRTSRVQSDLEEFNSHIVQGAANYRLSPAWSMSAAAGVVRLLSTRLTEGRTGPAWTVGVERNEPGRIIRADYRKTYLPSFGFGGTADSHEVTVAVDWRISRRVYTVNTAAYRNNSPLTDLENQLPLRSLRFTAAIGWQLQPWVSIEGFYSRLQQTSDTALTRVDRNRIGFQIATFKPMRMR